MSSPASISARSCSGNTGRPGPLFTWRSVVMVTTRSSPLRLPSSRCRLWPTCRMSNTPCASTTLRPSARAPAAIADSSSIDLILSSIWSVPGGGIANLLPIAKVIEPLGRGGRDAVGRPHRGLAPVFDCREHVLDAALDRHACRPAELGLDAAGIGESAVGLARALRNVDGLARAEQFDQPIDRDGSIAAHVVTAARVVRFGGGNQRRDGVGDVGEIALLGAVADDGQRLAGAELREEHTEHRAVGAAGARAGTVDVEEPQR